MCSEKTLYNYVDGCLFDIRNIDLPRKVKYRPRYKKPELKVDRGCRVGRNYHDYEVYMEQHPDTAVVQMDSVIGSKGGKVLLTIYFVNVSLMLGFLREANTSKSVIDIYDELYHRLGGQDFRKLFPVILTDNGSEFSNPKCIENGPDGKGFQRTRIYYCNPSAPYQKAEIEVGHEFIRRILPKGRSFDELTQGDINSFSDYASKYNTNVDYSYLFGGMQTPSTGSAFNLSDYAAIKNGSYGKLLKAYYAKQDAEKASSGGDTVQKSTLMKSGADALKKSADALNNDELWEKKKIKKKDEKTGEEIEVEDYDWEAITKAVKSFVEDYNDVVEQAGNSNSKDVLRNAVWMTGITESNENMLSKIGITVGKGNKLELDEEALKKADISSFKTLFTGHNSFADKVSMKANSISNAAARTSGTYKSNGTYNNALSELVSKKVDEEV